MGEDDYGDQDDDDALPRGTRLALTAATFLALFAGALLLADLAIKRDTVNLWKAVQDRLDPYEEGTPDGTPERGTNGRAGGLSGDRGVRFMEPTARAHPNPGQTPGVAPGPGGLLARGPGDGSVRDA